MPGELAGVTELEIAKNEIIKNLDSKSDLLPFFASIRPDELGVLRECVSVDNENQALGGLFETVFILMEMRKCDNNSPETRAMQVLQRTLADDDHGYMSYIHGKRGNSDFVKVNSEMEITHVYECKASPRALESMRTTPEVVMNTLRRVIDDFYVEYVPEGLKKIVEEIKVITDKKLTISSKCQYIFVFPKTMEHEKREESLEKKGAVCQYIKTTPDEMKAVAALLKKL